LKGRGPVTAKSEKKKGRPREKGWVNRRAQRTSGGRKAKGHIISHFVTEAEELQNSRVADIMKRRREDRERKKKKRVWGRGPGS